MNDDLSSGQCCVVLIRPHSLSFCCSPTVVQNDTSFGRLSTPGTASTFCIRTSCVPGKPVSLSRPTRRRTRLRTRDAMSGWDFMSAEERDGARFSWNLFISLALATLFWQDPHAQNQAPTASPEPSAALFRSPERLRASRPPLATSIVYYVLSVAPCT